MMTMRSPAAISRSMPASTVGVAEALGQALDADHRAKARCSRISISRCTDGERLDDDPVEDRDDEEGLEVEEAAGGFLLRRAHHLGDAEGEGERGALDHVDEVVEQRRCGDPGGLRQDDPPQRLQAGHADRGAGLPLAAVDAGDRGADALGHVGGEVQRQADDRRR